MSAAHLKELHHAFAADEIEWRLQQSGEKAGRVWAICVPYVTNRAIQSRLDVVAGPENWKNEFTAGPAGGVLCGLSIRIDEEWITKWDGAENTDIEGVKGGLSGAMKRAAVQWGIGRYLYELGDTFALVSERGKLRGKTRQGADFKWDPPELPAWALPGAPSPAAAGDSVPATGEEAGHAAMLHFVRRIGPQVDEGAEIKINRKVCNLKDFVRENWPTIKEQPRVARAVVEAIESATGIIFEEQAATA